MSRPGFNRSLIQGLDTGAKLYDRYQAAKQKGEISALASMKPEETTEYSPEDAQQLHDIANAKDAQGNPYYQLEAKQDGSYGLSMRGEDGSYAQVDGAQFKPQMYTEFMGQRIQGGLSPQQESKMRNAAIANATMKYDPVQGLQMQRQAAQDAREDERYGREQKKWEQEDSIAAIDKQLGGEWQKRLTGEDGQMRTPGPQDFVQQAQQRAYALGQAGHFKEANDAYKDALNGGYLQIRLDSAQREEAMGPAITAAYAGNFDGVKDFYNRFIPGGQKVTDIAMGKDGRLTMTGIGLDGKPSVIGQVGGVDELAAIVSATKDPMAVYNFAGHQLTRQLQLQSAARAAATHAQNMGLRQEKQALLGELAKDAGLTPTQARAVQLGLMKLPGLGGDEKFDINPSKVATYFSKADPDTPDKIRRSPEDERAFSAWAVENNITDTNKGLFLYEKHRNQQRNQAATALQTMRQQRNDPQYVEQAAKKAGKPPSAIIQSMDKAIERAEQVAAGG